MSQLVTESTKKNKKKNKEKKTKNEAHAIKWNKRSRANSFHEMTPIIVFIYNKERIHEMFPEPATGCVL